MPRPKSKPELIQLSNKNFENLMDWINALPENVQEKEFPKGTLNRNIRDVIGHLHHWHLMFLDWYSEGMAGNKPEMPAKGYSWKSTPELNRWIQREYREIPLNKMKKMLVDSYYHIQSIIQQHSNNELFEKKKYKWTGSTSLGSYLVSATSSHYDWALKLIKRSTKAST